MTLTHDDLLDYESASRREWLSVNHLGGFASGTVAGVQTRRYHALLVAALRPPVGRMAILSHLHETVEVYGMPFDLYTGRFADGTIHPQGWRSVAEFTELPVPTWRYTLPNGFELTKRIYLAPERNTVYVSYTRSSSDTFGEVTLTLAPLTAWKDYHAEMRPWDGYPLRQGFGGGGYELQSTADSPTLRFFVPGAKWSRAGWWHRDNYHEREADRGLDCIEHLYCPVTTTIGLNTGETITFVATIETEEPEDAASVLAEITQKQEAIFQNATAGMRQRLSVTAMNGAPSDSSSVPAGEPETDAAASGGITDSEWLHSLVNAADQFIVRGSGIRTTILAGFPWFTDWGRDTMIALPGLCIATGRYDIAREILEAFAGFVSEGMIPNRFPDGTEKPDYNTVDATLWFIHACSEYLQADEDPDFRQKIVPVIDTIIAAHEKGTRYGIIVDPKDGLLSAGEPGTQLTWMDAKIGDYVVTPRQGKAVEINALWLNALHIAAHLNGSSDYCSKAQRASASFRAAFVRPDGHGLYDVIRPDGSPDDAIRPNQIIAAALPYSALTEQQAKSTVDTVTRDLLTPYGLRTLSPASAQYRPAYAGNSWSRDSAYHQGTVWPWLLGPYFDARKKVYGDAPDLLTLLTHLSDCGVGGIAEIFDGDDPHRPNGCPWQAWSVAEVLRIYLAAGV